MPFNYLEESSNRCLAMFTNQAGNLHRWQTNLLLFEIGVSTHDGVSNNIETLSYEYGTLA